MHLSVCSYCISVYLKICVCVISLYVYLYAHTYSIYIYIYVCVQYVYYVCGRMGLFFLNTKLGKFPKDHHNFPIEYRMQSIGHTLYCCYGETSLWDTCTYNIHISMCCSFLLIYIYMYIITYIYIILYIYYIIYIYTCALYSPVKILTRVKCQAVKPLRESFRMFPACISCTNDLPGLALLKLSNLSISPSRIGVPQDSIIACAASRNLPYHAWAQPWGLCYRWCEVLRVQNLHLWCQNVSFVVHIILHSRLGCWDSNSSWLADFWTLRLETSNPVKLRRCHWLIGHHWSHKIWHSYTLWIPWMIYIPSGYLT